MSSPSRILLNAPAKLNLFFEVTGTRPDGYHEVETVTTLVTLYDQLVIRARPGSERAVVLSCIDARGEPKAAPLPGDGHNLAVKAYHLFAESCGNAMPVEIELTKRIPTEAGLGGGSSDAAAALFGLNRLGNPGLTTEELTRLAARLGSDVPLFFEKSPALGLGRGEVTCPLDAARELDFVIFKPPFGLSTAAVYRALDDEPRYKPRPSAPLAGALARGAETEELSGLLFNRLEATARRISPRLDACFEMLGPLAPFRLTGSGTALYTLVSGPDEAAGLKSEIEKTGIPGKVFACRSAASPLSPI